MNVILMLRREERKKNEGKGKGEVREDGR